MSPRDGASQSLVLFADGHEEVRIETWDAGEKVAVVNDEGIEFYVIEGSFHVHGENIAAGAWGRLPAGIGLSAVVSRDGAKVCSSWLRCSIQTSSICSRCGADH